MGCSSSTARRHSEVSTELLKQALEDPTGYSFTTTTELAHVSKSTLAAPISATPPESDKPRSRRGQESHPGPQHSAGKHFSSSQKSSRGDESDVQDIVQPDTLGEHSSPQVGALNESNGSLESAESSPAKRGQRRRQSSATSRRPDHLSKARERMSHERQRASVNSRKTVLAQAKKMMDDRPTDHILVHSSTSDKMADISQLGDSGTTVDLEGISSSVTILQAEKSRDVPPRNPRRSHASSRGKRASTEKAQSDLEAVAEEKKSSDASECSGSSWKRSSDSKRSSSSTEKRTRRKDSPRRHKTSKPSRTKRPQFPENEPRKVAEPRLGTTPDKTKAPGAQSTKPQQSAGVQHNFTSSRAQTMQKSIEIPSCHSKESLNSCLPEGIRQSVDVKEGSPDMPPSSRPSMSSMPPLESSSTLSGLDHNLEPEKESTLDGEAEFAPEGDEKLSKGGRRRSISDMVNKINPMRAKVHTMERLMSDSSEEHAGDGTTVQARLSGSSHATFGVVSNVMKQILKIPHGGHTDKESNDDAKGDESEHSLDIFSGEDDDALVVFKFDSSDPSVPQFDPARLDNPQVLHASTSAIDRIHKRQSFRGKRTAAAHHRRGQADDLRKSSLHSSCSHVDALKALEALKAPGHGTAARKGAMEDLKKSSRGTGDAKKKKRGTKQSRDKSVPPRRRSNPEEGETNERSQVQGEEAVRDTSGKNRSRRQRRHTEAAPTGSKSPARRSQHLAPSSSNKEGRTAPSQPTTSPGVVVSIKY